MIDHILGRPSTRFRKYQVFVVVLLWSLYLSKSPRHGPSGIRQLSQWLSRRFSMHQAMVVFCVALYVSRNFARVVGLESPEPLANLYDRGFFRATWVTTALDAGFWTAMHLRPGWLRHTCEIAFTFYYLVCAEQADELCRRVRGDLSIQHLRVSWNKTNTPVLRFVANMLRPKFMKYKPRAVTIPRPGASDYKAPIRAWLYFDGPRQDLKSQDKIVLDIPGGGFVAMDPRCHDDRLMAWAGKLGIPVLSLDYKKAPEYPYPYALYECYDAYYQLIASRGTYIGLSGECIPKIIVSGDSAGGNLAIGMTLLLLDAESPLSNWESGVRVDQALPLPEAIVGVYPALEMNIGSWMSDEQLALLKTPKQRRENKRILERKTDDYRRLAPNSAYASEDEDDENMDPTKNVDVKKRIIDHMDKRPKTRLAMSSMISYFNDRIISPEMSRAMILLYVGEHNKPDLATDHLLSPLRAPEALLSKFPRTFLLCGERDPLVDDTAIFAGRLRQAHGLEFRRRQELGLEPEDAEFDDKKHVEVVFVNGVSHGFLQFVSVFPGGWEYIHHCSRWIRSAFEESDAQEPPSVASNSSADDFSYTKPRSRRSSEASGDERPLEIPSKLRMTQISAPTKNRASTRQGASGSGRPSSRIQHSSMSGRKSPAARRSALVAKLGSTEDLLARRMKVVTEGLTGDQNDRSGAQQ